MARFERVFEQVLKAGLDSLLTNPLTLYRLPIMGNQIPRMTTQTLRVLGAFTACLPDELSGAEIAKRTKLQSGTLYPILARLEQAEWLESKWEDGDPRDLGRPRRRLYQMTGLGARSARAEFREVSEAIGGLTWEHS